METVYNLKLPTFMGNEGHAGSERWLEHVDKTFQVMQSQGSLSADRWVETISGFWIDNLLLGGTRKLTGGLPKRKQIGGISSGRFIRDSFLHHTWIRRSRSLPILNRRNCLLLSII